MKLLSDELSESAKAASSLSQWVAEQVQMINGESGLTGGSLEAIGVAIPSFASSSLKVASGVLHMKFDYALLTFESVITRATIVHIVFAVNCNFGKP